MTPPTVWFNKHLTNTWEVLALLQEAKRPGEFRLCCSHPRGKYPGQLHADVFEKEPHGLADPEYVDYCLDFARRQRVDLFLPGHRVRPLTEAHDRFAAIGTRLLAAGDARTLNFLNHKGRVYAALGSSEVRLPSHEVFHDLDTFDAAWSRLRPDHDWLCCKPAVSVYGIGFHILDDPDSRRPRPRVHRYLFLQQARFRGQLADKGRGKDWLLMQYLPGPERSVDCLAHDGALVRCIVRRKKRGGQIIEEHADIEAAVRRITARFGLTGLFNVQFRDAAGVPYLLEINTRMSGGLPFACRSGLIPPLWAIRFAPGTVGAPRGTGGSPVGDHVSTGCGTGEPPVPRGPSAESWTMADIPQPQTDIWVPQPKPVRSA